MSGMIDDSYRQRKSIEGLRQRRRWDPSQRAFAISLRVPARGLPGESVVWPRPNCVHQIAVTGGQGHYRAPPGEEPSLLRVSVLRPPRTPAEGHDLRGFSNIAEAVVPRHVPHGQHSLRLIRKAARAGAWSHLQRPHGACSTRFVRFSPRTRLLSKGPSSRTRHSSVGKPSGVRLPVAEQLRLAWPLSAAHQADGHGSFPARRRQSSRTGTRDRGSRDRSVEA
jgi:hypothetical protein